MIPFEEAERILREVPLSIHVEKVPIAETLGRILAEDVVSPHDMPPFDKSAMDGFAFKSGDPFSEFKIVETISAGSVPTKAIELGQCAKIMTGGKVPEGADRVVKREVTSEQNGIMRIIGEDENINICRKGEDLKTGDIVLTAGTLLRPAEVGISASMGLDRISVYRRPEIGILTTGSELVKPGAPLKDGLIYDSNSYSLAAQAVQMGVKINRISSVPDDPEVIRQEVRDMLDSCGVVFISGGVSMGDFDYVPGILRELGIDLLFEKVAVKPGKPTVFGTNGDKFVFGIPGNPVSTFVIFEVFIKPFLFRKMGHNYRPEIVEGILKTDFRRRNAERLAFVPVKYRVGGVELLPFHGSAHIQSLSRANGLLAVPREVTDIQKETCVHVRLI